MKKTVRCFIFVLIVNLSAHADLWIIDSEENPNLPQFENNTLFISLGAHCLPAGLLRDSGLRKAAFPFDWILSLDNEGVARALEDDFLYFLDDGYLIPDSLLVRNANGANLVHSMYHFEFVHEGMFLGADIRPNLESLRNRYHRRIERFKKLSDYSGTVIFLRMSYRAAMIDINRSFKNKEVMDIPDEDALRLYHALKYRFPNLRMKLVILNEGDPPLHGIVTEKVLSDGAVVKVRYAFPTEKELYSEYKKYFHSLASKEGS